MPNEQDMKATVVAYNKEWSTVYARLDLNGPYPKPLVVKVPIDENREAL